MVVLVCLAGVLFCLLPMASKHGLIVSMLFLTITHVCSSSYLSPLVSMAFSVTDRTLAEIGLAWFNSVATLGGVIGPFMIGCLASATGTYVSSFYASGICCFSCGLLFLAVNDSLHARKQTEQTNSIAL